MHSLPTSRKLLYLAGISFLWSQYANAVISLDFSVEGYISGSLTQSYDIDASNPGDDITITFTSNTSAFQTNRPAVNDAVTGGGNDTLSLFLNFEDEIEKITITIDFLYDNGVTGVYVPLYDVDIGTDAGSGNFTFSDEINDISSRFDAITTPIDSANITTNSGSSYFASSTSVRGIAENSPNTATDGNVILGFSDTVLKSLTFTYENYEPTTPDNPSQQSIGIGIITYTEAVPEAKHFAALISVAIVGFVGFQRRRQ